MTGTSTNATKQLLGYDYQKFLALESCLNAKENETIWIECFGDIAHGRTSYEVKHHQDKENLNDTHIDFWKTLYNIANEHHIYADFNRFELITTSKINESSIFFNWENYTGKIKLSTILSITPTKTINKYYQFLEKFNKADLTKILDALIIKYNQPTIEEKYEQLKSHNSFLVIPDIYIDDFMHKMLGYISSQAIKNMDRWHIDRNDFKREMEFFAKPFMREEYPFPRVKKSEIKSNNKETFYFLDELKILSLDDTQVNNATVDFLRAEKSTLKILKLNSSMAENLEEFDDNLQSTLALTKLKHQPNTQYKKIDKSRVIYAECLTLGKMKILGIQEIDDYFQKGRIHSIVERKYFSWIYR